jgi:hypothetical protein
MDIRLEPVAWEGGEAFRISFDGDGESLDGCLGHAWRKDADTWALSARDPMDTDDENAATLKAETSEALRILLASRFRAIEIPNDRLSIQRMHEVTAQVLIVLAMLAKRTGARPGFIAALAGAVARTVVADIKPDGEAAFLAAFDAELKADITTMRAMGEMQRAFAHTFAELFKTDDDEAGEAAPGGPATH